MARKILQLQGVRHCLSSFSEMGLAAAIALQHFRFGMLSQQSFSSSSIEVTYMYIYICAGILEETEKGFVHSKAAG